MQMSFDGVEEIEAPVDKIRTFVMNTEQIASCIPDSQDFMKIDETHFTLNVQIGVGVVSGLFALNVELKSQNPDGCTYAISGRGSGSEISVTLNINMINEGERSTKIEWSSTANLSGVISGLGEQIIRQITRKEINQILENAKKKIETV